MKNVIKEFDKKFTRKSKGLEDKGKFRDDWFIKDYITSKEVKDFILKVQKDTKGEILKKIDTMIKSQVKLADQSDKLWSRLLKEKDKMGATTVFYQREERIAVIDALSYLKKFIK